jgi:hypothetical protein
VSSVTVARKEIVAGAPKVCPLVGLVSVTTGRPFAVNVTLFEAMPPGGGFSTDTVNEPEACTSVAGMAAVSVCALTKVVVRFAPLNRTIAPLTKLLPLTVSVNAPLPTSRTVGAMLVTVGTGLSGGSGPLPS